MKLGEEFSQPISSVSVILCLDALLKLHNQLFMWVLELSQLQGKIAFIYENALVLESCREETEV